MRILDYLLYASGRPCHHYLPRPVKHKPKRDKFERLTFVDDRGNWYLRGVVWPDTYVGATINEYNHRKIYEALRRLIEYEDTGLSPDEVWHLKEYVKDGVKNG